MGSGRGLLLMVVAAIALVTVQAAGANRLRTNSTDQAKARSGVLKLADLPPVGGWKSAGPSASGGGSGGPSGDLSCAGYNPKSSDLVTTGTASSEFYVPGLDVSNEVRLLSSERMVELDWKRSMADGILPCLGKAFKQGAGGKVEIISVRKIPFAGFATHSAAYRIVFGITVSGKPVRGVADFIALAGGRTEASLMLVAAIGPPSQQRAGEADMTKIDRELSRIVAARVFAPIA